MATRILVNSVLLGTSQLWPGSTFDTVKDATDIADITAAGGLLWDGADPIVAAYAVLARAVRQRAGDLSAAESLMQSGVQDSQSASIASVAGSIPTATSSVAQAVASATTGLTVDSAVTGATVDSASLVAHETLFSVEAAAVALGTIAESAATANPTAQPGHPRVLDVVFAAGWEGGDVTVTGVKPDGSAQTETFTSPGIGGGTVSGTKPFALIDDPGGITNSATGGAADLATVQTAAGIGVATVPFLALVKLSVDGADEAATSVSLANGYFVPTTSPDGTKTYEVWYTAGHAHAVTDAGHAHAVTDAGHAHAGVAHSHALV
jgi:hypothetical protein